MGIQFFKSPVLLQRLRKQNEVTFLLGSALTAKRNGVGIPDVSGMTEIFKSYAEQNGLLEDYEQELQTLEPQQVYQESFAYLSAVLGPQAIKDIVEQAVMCNFDIETQKHKIPAPVEDLVSLIATNELKVKNIITTNFDTLIEEELTNRGIKFNSYSIVTDSNIQNANNGLINIIHMHGIWNNGDSMHTSSQLEQKRERIESSLRRLLDGNHVVIMGYSGWVDSFTRTLISIMSDDQAKYNVAWCFYESDESIINGRFGELFKNLSNAISNSRIVFFKGIDCTTLFKASTRAKAFSASDRTEVAIGVRKSPSQSQNQNSDIIFYTPEIRDYYENIRLQAQDDAVSFLKDRQSVFVESSLGFGLFGFVSSLIPKFGYHKISFVRVDMTDVISKSETENRIQTQSGLPVSELIFRLCAETDQATLIIFDNIRANVDEDALRYLLSIANLAKDTAKNIFLILSSGTRIRLFDEIRIFLAELTFHETMLVLQAKFGMDRFKSNEVSDIHDKAEGVIGKLERIIYFLEDSSTEEVLDGAEVLDHAFYHESIPSVTLKQIELLSNTPEKRLTFMMLKLLSVLKNGETLNNLRKSSLGKGLTPSNTKELINLEMATSNHLDNTTTIIKVNPIIKDYVLSNMPDDEIYAISQAYLGLTIVEGQDGIKISSVNRKIYDVGYHTEEDNANTLLRIAITQCKEALKSSIITDSDRALFETKLRKFLYLSRAYVYSLSNSSRFNESIIASYNILHIISDIAPDDAYRYYSSLAYAYRMQGNYIEARRYIKLSKEFCPESDKATLKKLYTEELYILESINISDAVDLAKRRKNEFRKDDNAYIISEYILSLLKTRGEQVKCIARLEKKSRKLGYHTTANNLLFKLAESYDTNKKLSSVSKIMTTDQSNYNLARALIFKMETLVESGLFNRITKSDIENMHQAFNYLFRQQFDGLFNRCYDVLVAIARENNKESQLPAVFFKAIIMWKLNFNQDNEKKYSELIESHGFANTRIEAH